MFFVLPQSIQELFCRQTHAYLDLHAEMSCPFLAQTIHQITERKVKNAISVIDDFYAAPLYRSNWNFKMLVFKIWTEKNSTICRGKARTSNIFDLFKLARVEILFMHQWWAKVKEETLTEMFRPSLYPFPMSSYPLKP